jgi:hypothetical protein
MCSLSFVHDIGAVKGMRFWYSLQASIPHCLAFHLDSCGFRKASAGEVILTGLRKQEGKLNFLIRDD